MMMYDIQAVLLGGSNAFEATLPYLPRKDDEIEIGGYVFSVVKVRFIIDTKTMKTNVRLIVRIIEDY